MDLRQQSSAMCVIMLGGEDTHTWSATEMQKLQKKSMESPEIRRQAIGKLYRAIKCGAEFNFNSQNTQKTDG